MIISASRRTDIPSFFGDWFYNRVKEGSVLVRNPRRPHQISKVSLNNSLVDCIVFWTKNPADSFINNLSILDDMGYKYYFLFTITSYSAPIEKNIPPKNSIITKFKTLSKLLGRDRVVWRYDPVLITSTYTLEYHKKYFATLAAALSGSTSKCIISFLDVYKKIAARLDNFGIATPNSAQIADLVESFLSTANKYNIRLESCCEELGALGVSVGSCVSCSLISKICGKHFIIKKDSAQRASCGCVKSVDIGYYNTCRNGCAYCYATWGDCQTITQDPNSAILGPPLTALDVVKERVITSCKVTSGAQSELPFADLLNT